ncbi:MAG TPA: hypothetical protein PKV38_17020, partial [bacterium]|nr:hypothetical protein [bacterium]
MEHRLGPIQEWIGGITLYSILFFIMLWLTACSQNILKPAEFLKPTDFLYPPSIIDPGREFGHLGTVSVVVSATANIFLARAEPDVIIESPKGDMRDQVPANSPVQTLDGRIVGGETLEIYANGTARHEPAPSVEFGPKGRDRTLIEVGPVLGYHEFEGPIGALVGLFNNQRVPFVIGQRKQVIVPR